MVLTLVVVMACRRDGTGFKSNELLIDFKSSTVMNMDELVALNAGKYKKLALEEFNHKTDIIRFEMDRIYVSRLFLVNGCGRYAGDVEVREDSLYLKLINVGDVTCTEQRVID